MKSSDINLKAIPQNFKELFADKKQFVFECIRLGIVFFFFIWTFVPYFTLKETGFGVIAHFNIGQHAGFFAFIIMLAWWLAFLIFPLSLLTPFKKFSNFVLLGIAGIELLYWFITLIVYWVNLADLNALNIPTMSMPLNIGFWFILIHIGFVVLIALLPKPIKALTDKIVIAASSKKPAPAQEAKKEEPVEAKEEPVVEEKPAKPEVKEEPPVEEPKKEAVEEPKPEVEKKPEPEQPKE
jgi:hypothetical protein